MGDKISTLNSLAIGLLTCVLQAFNIANGLGHGSSISPASAAVLSPSLLTEKPKLFAGHRTGTCARSRHTSPFLFDVTA